MIARTMVLLLVFLCSGLAGAQEQDLLTRARERFAPVPPAPTDQGERAALGRMLYFDPRLSHSGRVSCNSCHNLALGGDDDRITSAGHGWVRAPRNVPTILNTALNRVLFWDGRVGDLHSASRSPARSGLSMYGDLQRVVAVLDSMEGYRQAFQTAFPDQAAPLTLDNAIAALEAFVATLTTPDAPFDRYLAGDPQALNRVQQRGLRLFLDRGCVTCHAGANLGGEEYYPFGVMERPGAQLLPPGDRGRFMVTETATDRYVFRSPGLRNVALTAPYFHSGRVQDLEQAVAVMGTFQLGKPLTPEESKAITAFLHSLTGRQPQLDLPSLPASGGGTPPGKG